MCLEYLSREGSALRGYFYFWLHDPGGGRNECDGTSGGSAATI